MNCCVTGALLVCNGCVVTGGDQCYCLHSQHSTDQYSVPVVECLQPSLSHSPATSHSSLQPLPLHTTNQHRPRSGYCHKHCHVKTCHGNKKLKWRYCHLKNVSLLLMRTGKYSGLILEQGTGFWRQPPLQYEDRLSSPSPHFTPQPQQYELLLKRRVYYTFMKLPFMLINQSIHSMSI